MINRLGLLLLAVCWMGGRNVSADLIPASDPTFLGSVLDETWDTRNAVSKGYIDGMVPLTDVDLTVNVKYPGPVVLHFDTSIYPASQAPNAGPLFEVAVDGVYGARVTVGPSVSTVSTSVLSPGRHRVRFVASSNTSSPRWNATDPQLARVTGVEIPAGSHLEKSQRPKSWFLAITDSIGEGILDMNTTTGTWRTNPPGAYSDADRAWPAETARLLHDSICGYLIGGIGVVHPGTGVPLGAISLADPSGASDPWDHIFAGVPRPFTTAPDFIILCIGTNECGTDVNMPGHGTPDPNSADAPLTANVETFFARVRAHPQMKTTPIFVSVPFTGCKRPSLQKAVAEYRAKHPGERHIELLDLAYGSPALKTTAGIDEEALFAGLSKGRADDSDTVPSPQASDRTHPYAIATPAIGSVNAHLQLAEVIAPWLKSMLAGGPPPKTGPLTVGPLLATRTGLHVNIAACFPPALGGSAPYSFQFEKSTDGGKTWAPKGDVIGGMQAILHPLTTDDQLSSGGAPIWYRLRVTDTSDVRITTTSPISKETP